MAFGPGVTQVTDLQENYSILTGGYAAGVPNEWGALLRARSASGSVAIGYDTEIFGVILGLQARLERRNLDDLQVETYQGVPHGQWLTRYESRISRHVSLRLGRVLQERAMAYVSLGRVSSDYTRSYIDLGGFEDVFTGTDTGNSIGLGYEIGLRENWNLAVDVRRVVHDRTVQSVLNAYPNGGEDAAHDAVETGISFMVVRRF